MRLFCWILRAALLAAMLSAVLLLGACVRTGVSRVNVDELTAATATTTPLPEATGLPIAWQDAELESAAGTIRIMAVTARGDGTLAITIKLKDGGEFTFNTIVGLASASADGNLYVELSDGTQAPIIETAQSEADPASWDLIFPVGGQTEGLVLIFPQSPPIDVSPE